MPAVTTAVFPIAGLATRFLPASKAMPKVMLPIIDKPLIQYAVEEALESGIEHLVFVASEGHHIVADHFTPDEALEETLAARSLDAELASVRATSLAPGNVTMVYQDEPLGLGHAVWCAREAVGDGPFAVMLADELILADRPQLAELRAIHERTGGNVVGVVEVPPEDTGRYGILDPVDRDGRVLAARSVVEKPAPAEAPSRLALIGRYVLDPAVLDELGAGRTGHGGEIQLTDAIAATTPRVPLHAWEIEGTRHDCGNKPGFLEATVAQALSHPDLADVARDIVARYADELPDGPVH